MILELEDIKLSFADSGSEIFNLLNGVSFAVEPGRITALVGGNGTGKTTLFNIVSGFQDGYSGRVLFEGRDISSLSSWRIARLGIGRLFQGRQLMGDLTLMENIKIASDDTMGENPFASLYRPRMVRRAEEAKAERAVAVLERLFGRECKYLRMLDRKASELSYGEQRLIALARLLMGRNKLLLLDEPTAGVNPVLIGTIERMIRRMVDEEGLTVLLIEHNMHFVRHVADTCAYLDDGSIEKVGPTATVLDDKEVRNSYLGL